MHEYPCQSQSLKLCQVNIYHALQMRCTPAEDACIFALYSVWAASLIGGDLNRARLAYSKEE